MRHKSGSYEMDMCSGSILPKMIQFSLPLVLTGVLQLLYNAADIVVVGQFAENGTRALAAVSSTGALINLIVNIFLGLSVGASVCVAQDYGAGDQGAVSRAVHTSIGVSLAGGVIVSIIGLTMCETFLIWMGTPEDVLAQATLYMRIIFAGMLPNLLYNFGAAILRAVGDTRRPLYFLTFAGIINVLLNMVFVILLRMDVAGVALATIISQLVSAVLVTVCLMRTDGAIHLSWRKIAIHKREMGVMLRIGLPAGFQGALFSISNVLIQSSINSFGSDVMAGNGAAGNLEGFVYTAMNAVHQAAITFTGQNVGARKFERIGRILGVALGIVTVIGVVLGGFVYLFGNSLLRLYLSAPTPAVIEAGLMRLSIICTTYFLCGWMDVLVGSLRGMGASLTPMIVTVLGACGLRIVWILTVFAMDRRLDVLYWSYPVSWFVTASAHMVSFFFIRRSLLRREGVLPSVGKA